MRRLAKKIFQRLMPGSLHSPLIGLFRLIRDFLLLILRDMWLPIYRIDQPGKMTVIMIGTKACDPYLIRLIFGEYLPPARIGTVPVCALRWKIRRLERAADLIVFRDRRLHPPRSLALRMVRMPHYVMQFVDLPPAEVDLKSAFRSTSNENDLRRIRKARFDYEITRDPAQLEFFYHQMYRPFIQTRHRDAADIAGWNYFSRAYRNWELLLIHKDGRPVAGSLNGQNGDEYILYEGGVLQADRELLKAGIISAMHWYSFIEARKRGCVRANLRCSRPFLKDGVLGYKKKWNSRIVQYDGLKRPLWLQFCANRPAVSRFLEDNPFIVEQNGGLVSLIFLGPHTELDDAALEHYLNGCLFEGKPLSTTLVLLTPEWAARQDRISEILQQHPQPVRVLNLSDRPVSAALTHIINQDLAHD